MNIRRMVLAGSVLLWVQAFACGSSSNGNGNGSTSNVRPTQAGAACSTADDCYTQNVDRTQIVGTIECLQEVRDGYCTHQCSSDADCCAVDGECPASLEEVCAPFQSTGVNRCFLSCENSVLTPNDAGVVDGNDYCQRMASPDFICRSTGGGSGNRKVCVPGTCGVGAGCTADADCPTGTVCLTDFNGGYCSVDSCTADNDCPNGSRCAVGAGGRQYCMVECASPTDCSFCRPNAATTCTADVALADGTTASLCVPSPG